LAYRLVNRDVFAQNCSPEQLARFNQVAQYYCQPMARKKISPITTRNTRFPIVGECLNRLFQNYSVETQLVDSLESVESDAKPGYYYIRLNHQNEMVGSPEQFLGALFTGKETDPNGNKKDVNPLSGERQEWCINFPSVYNETAKLITSSVEVADEFIEQLLLIKENYKQSLSALNALAVKTGAVKSGK